MKKLLSVIIPAYNVEKYIRRCLDSVFAAFRQLAPDSQPLTSVEIIVVDDGSSDDTGAILDEYAEKVKVIHQPNGGEGAARNAGLAIATGEYIGFLDADDIWAPTFLTDVFAAIKADGEADMLSVLQWNFNDGADETPPLRKPVSITVYDTATNLSSPLFMISVCSTIYKRSVFGDLRFTFETIGADRIYTMKCLARSRRAIVLSARDYGYRFRADSMAHANKNERRYFDSLVSAAACPNILAASNKPVDLAVRRGMYAGWIEQKPAEFARLSDKNCRARLWKKWVETLKSAPLSFFTPYQRLVMRLMVLTRSRTLAYFLCVLPFKLKRLRRRCFSLRNI